LVNTSQVSVIAVGNSIQSYTTLYYTKRIYNLDPSKPSPAPTASKTSPAYPDTLTANSTVTPLSARTFGTWTFLTSIVRLYVAYNITNPAFYQLGLATYVVAFLHFFSEWLVFGTAGWGAGLAGPVFVSTGTISWMLAQWGFYTQ
jgi:hypothetical protein